MPWTTGWQRATRRQPGWSLSVEYCGRSRPSTITDPAGTNVNCMTETWDDDLALALELADLADRITMARFRATDLKVETKPDRSPVTEADRAVESGLWEHVAAARPGDGRYGEEFGSTGEPLTAAGSSIPSTAPRTICEGSSLGHPDSTRRRR